MIKSSLCDYSGAYIHVSGTITVARAGANNEAIAADRNKKEAIFKDFTQFTDCITEINNTQVENEKDLDVVMPMHNSIEYSKNYSKISEILYQFYKDEPNDNDIAESESFKSKWNFLGSTNNAGIINSKITVPLKYLSNFWKTLEIPLINLILTWSTNCVISEGDRETTFTIIDTKIYVPVFTLLTQGNTRLLQLTGTNINQKQQYKNQTNI